MNIKGFLFIILILGGGLASLIWIGYETSWKISVALFLFQLSHVIGYHKS